jgi:hypothetical protein
MGTKENENRKKAFRKQIYTGAAARVYQHNRG